MEHLTIQTSKKYRPRLRQLLRIAGYDLAHEVEGTFDLANFIAEHDLFYPEEIASQFVAWRWQSENTAHDAMAEILQAGFFNDEGVESYASPCAPMVLGLAEMAALATQARKDTRIVLGSADISNLGRLNEIYPDRSTTAPLLQHLIHRSREAMDAWAEAHGYHIDTMILRNGGDEFKYVLRFRTSSGDTIDDEMFASDIAELNAHVTRANEACAREYLVDQIPHYKENRAPGVINTLALRALDAQAPDIEHTLIELGGDIAAIREERTARIPPGAPTASTDLIRLPKSSPRPHRPLPAQNPYHDSPLQPHGHESLEHFSLRKALEKVGFDALAQLDDLFIYNPRRRWEELNEQHPAFQALGDDQKRMVRGALEAEHLRGLIDPVSRNYSAAFVDLCRDLAHHQGKTKGLVVEIKNLGGMNLLGDLLGDAVLREVGGVIDTAYNAYLAPAGDSHKPMVARQNGGEFVVFFDKNIRPEAVRRFSQAVRQGIEAINETRINDFSTRHRIGNALSKSAQNGYITIGDIRCPRNDAHGANFGLNVEFKRENNERTQTANWQTFVQSTPAPHQFIKQ